MAGQKIKASTNWVSIQRYKIFHLDKSTQAKREEGQSCTSRMHWTHIERKATATRTAEIIQVDINPKNEVHIKLVLIYSNTTITAVDDNMFCKSVEEILLTQNEYTSW